MLRLARLVILLSFVHHVQCMSEDECGDFRVDQEKGIHSKKRLVNHGLLNDTVRHPMQCFTKCGDNCLCESFNVCGDRCELSSSTKNKSLSDLRDVTKCTYYDMSRVKLTQPGSTTATCGRSSQLFCCRHHNPCLNGGECVGICPDLGKRFECRCRNGYYGNRCQAYKPNTCQDYWTSPKSVTGKYVLFDGNGNSYEAFCDFDSEQGMGWTLVASHSREISFPSFISSFSARNKDSAGTNWGAYWPERSLVNFLSEKSSHWRVTCEYNTRGVDYVDYLRSKMSATNMMTYKMGDYSGNDRCRLMEYVNIKGRECKDCTVALHQGSVEMHLRHDKSFSCDLKTGDLGNGCVAGTIEYYFGGLKSGTDTKCYTGNHRCSSTIDSTTQIWVGGKLN